MLNAFYRVVRRPLMAGGDQTIHIAASVPHVSNGFFQSCQNRLNKSLSTLNSIFFLNSLLKSSGSTSTCCTFLVFWGESVQLHTGHEECIEVVRTITELCRSPQKNAVCQCESEISLNLLAVCNRSFPIQSQLLLRHSA